MTQERYQEAAEWLKGDALGWCKNSHLHAIDTPQHKESVGIAEKVELAAEVLSKLASGWVLVPGEPVAWLHTMTYETGDKRYAASMKQTCPWGVQGRDFSSEFGLTATPLYAAAPKP